MADARLPGDGYTLINAPPSPFGRKVAIALHEKGIAFTTRHDVPWTEGTCTPQFSPLEQLPILLTPSGAVYDSRHILEWLELEHPTPALVPADKAAAMRQRLVQTLAERLIEIAQGLVFEQQRAGPSSAWILRQNRKLAGGVAELERLAGETVDTTRNGEHIHVGDIALGATLSSFEFMVEAGFCPPSPNLCWRDDRHPGLRRWVESLERRPSFERTPYGLMQVDIVQVIS
jgi:glutathione S-transferase